MKVRELIEELKQFNGEWDIALADEGGEMKILSIYKSEVDETVWVDIE